MLEPNGDAAAGSIEAAAGGSEREHAEPEERAEPEACEAALSAGIGAFELERIAWRAASDNGRRLRGFRRRAEAAERRALVRFDGLLSSLGECGPERAKVEAAITEEVQAVFRAQRDILEQLVARGLSQRLLSRMRQRGGPLRVQEKIDMFRDAIVSYHSVIQSLLPAGITADPEQMEVEQRLGELQSSIEASSEGRNLLRSLEQRRQQVLLRSRASGTAVSLDPVLRMVVRPAGFGNLQVFAEGPAGLPDSPSAVQVHVGVVNDGSVADGSREHPVPPKIIVQPAVRVNAALR